jgi:tetratricopeptide (TPR) repeat protein
MRAMAMFVAFAQLAPPATADPAAPDPLTNVDAATLRERARTSFDAGRFAEAAEVLSELYAIDPRPEYLYSRGQALRLAGDCAGAIGALDAFLATAPPKDDVADAEHWIARCREHLGPQNEPPPPVVPKTQAEAPPPAAPAQADVKWQRDPLAVSLCTVGLAGMVTGAGLVGGAFATASSDAEESMSEHVDRQRRADRLAIAGWSVLGVGSALVVGAIVRWVVVRRRARRH